MHTSPHVLFAPKGRQAWGLLLWVRVTDLNRKATIVLWTTQDFERVKQALSSGVPLKEAYGPIPARTVREAFKRLGWPSPGAVASSASVVRAGQRDDSGQHEASEGSGQPDEPDREPWAQPKGLTRVLIMPDAHLPYQHDLAWRTFLEVARGWRPDVLVILGDAVDFYCVSQHPKDPARRIRFEDEIRLSNEGLDQLSALRVPRVIYCEGNHETRLSRHVAAKTPELHGVVNVQDLLRVKQRGWEWVSYGHHMSIGKLSFTHDIGFAGVYAARQSVMAFGGSITIGHTHRAQTHYESTVNGERHVGHTMGWLGDPECIDYRHRARVARESQHGFGVAHILDCGMHFSHFTPIVDGIACVDGRLFSGRGT